MREGDGAEEVLLAELFAGAFDHHDGVGCAGDDDLHPARFVLRKRRVADVVAVFVASDANGGDGLLDGTIRNCERGAGGANREHVGVEFGIDRKHRRDDLNVVAEAVGKQWPDRTVDLARGKRGVFGRTSFALDVSSGDLAGGVHPFFEFAGEREEIDSFARLRRNSDGGENDVLLAVTDEGAAVGLFR